MKKPVLVIMAAGMGSRYGGLKHVFFRYVPVYFGNGTFYPLFVAVCEFRTDVVELLAS